jgi:hypothetical protein
MRISKNTQEKLQDILKAQGFVVRFERGDFRGGYCVVMEQQMIIINKFHPLESKINALLEIIRDVEIDLEKLTEAQVKWVNQIKAGDF